MKNIIHILINYQVVNNSVLPLLELWLVILKLFILIFDVVVFLNLFDGVWKFVDYLWLFIKLFMVVRLVIKHLSEMLYLWSNILKMR